MSAGCVIVGGGHAGFHTANALREAGYAAPITIVDVGDGLPYERPPLSKAYLLGSVDRVGLDFRPAEFYAAADIRVVPGTRVTGIRRADKAIDTVDVAGHAAEIAYEYLVLATGSRPRPLDVPGAGATGVHRLATTADADALGAALDTARRIVIVGAGFIGLECAAVAVERGLDVTVLNQAPRALGRATSTPVAEYVCDWHAERKVRIHHNTAVSEFTTLGAAGSARSRVISVLDTDGRTHPADLVVVGIGADPLTGLAEAAGLEVDGGVVVDEHLRTNDPAIFAVGDCARYPHGLIGERIRLESVQNATDHGRCIAASLTGNARPYDAVPWFWSDQGDLKLQIAGLTAGADDYVVRGNPESGRFSVYCYREGRLVGVDSVRRAADHVQARRLLAAGITPTPEQAADTEFRLATLLVSADSAA